MARVYLDGITRQYRTATAIDNITFEVPDGEFWVLVGPSGCGKSTILRTIAGLEPVSIGNLFIGDRLVNAIPARDRDVAMVFQNYALYPHMTVAQNLAFGLKMRKANSKTIGAQTEAVAKSLNIAHLLDRKPGQLSGGQQQRVALGRAIIRQPQVFLLDEPLSNLDAQLRDETRAELKALHQQLGITTIYVTHDQTEAMTLADRIVVLNGGQVQQIGDPQTVYAQPTNQMVATFLGSPPMNILPAIVTETGVAIGSQSFPLPDILTEIPLAPQDPLVLGIRPEHLHIADSSASTHLRATVALVEPLGRETLVRVTVPDDRLSLNLHVSPTLHPQVGDSLPLYLQLDQLFVFDAHTGARLV